MTATQGLPPRVIVGTLNFSRRTSEDESIALLQRAYEMGITGINTADTDYSGRSESYVSRFLRKIPESERPFLMVELSGADMGVPHDPNLSPEYLRRACERSLDRLGVDSVDRVVIPRPSIRIPLEETLKGVHELIIEPGLAASYGVSTFPGWLTCHGQHVCQSQGYKKIASELAPYNILDRRAENELLPNARFWGMEFFAWGALAQGLLAGRYVSADQIPPDSRAAVLGGIYAERIADHGRRVAAQFVDICVDFAYDPATAALAWLLTQSGVSGIVVGPRTLAHLGPMKAALELVLPLEFVQMVDAINPPGTAVADFFNSAPWMLQRV